MSRITKTLAQEVADKMTATRRETIRLKKSFYKESIYNEIRKTIPKDVLDFFEKYPQYTETSQSIRISGNGFNYEYEVIDKELPSKRGQNFQYTPSEEIAKSLLEKKNEIEKLKIETESLRKEIESTIFNLKTYKYVQENFPEAFEYFPTQKITTALSLNISDLRNRINSDKK